MIDAKLGITYNNMPDTLFPLMVGDGGMASGTDGGPKISVSPDNKNEAVEIIRSTVSMRVGAMVPEVVPIGEHTVLIRQREAVAEGATNVEPQAPDAGAQTEQTENVIENNNLENNQAGDVNRVYETNTQQAVPAAPTATQNGIVSPSQGSMVIPIEDDDVISNMIAKEMENELSSSVKNVEGKIAELEKVMFKALDLKRQIAEATMPVRDNPIIGDLKRQVTEIRNADNMVDEICFVDGAIFVKTKEIVTDEAIEGHRRIIGRMSIKISLKPMVGSATQTNKPVEVHNLDRMYRSGGTLWECGHIKNGGGLCWGNAIESVFNAFEQRSIEAVVDILLRFIRNPNTADGWGRHVGKWPAYSQQPEVN
jgi:hypothetical protein